MKLDKKWLEGQIKDYRKEFPFFKKYAETLERVLAQACRLYAPLSIVQARPKSLSSFAEKAIRQANLYSDPVRHFTDLCGARVITHTQAQVTRISRFIRENFLIDESNSPDIRSRLKANEFGYLSVHFVVQVRSAAISGIKIPKQIGDRKAEIQVRTLLQHGWAEITHDRIYKAQFKVPEEVKRELARTAALLEEADDGFSQAVGRLDAYKQSYGTYLERDKMGEELGTLKAVLENEPIDANKPGTALRIAKVAKTVWDWGSIIEQLGPFIGAECLEKAEILMEHGHALCRSKKDRPYGAAYKKGQRELERAVKEAEGQTRIQALSYYAWSHGNLPGHEHIARELYDQAHKAAPLNPYILASYLEFAMYCEKDQLFVQHLRHDILQAVETCRAHANAGIELPWAFFTMGKLYLVLEDMHQSLAAYARAISLCTAGKDCFPQEVIDDEMKFLKRIDFGRLERQVPDGHRWAEKLLMLGKSVKFPQDRIPQGVQDLILRKGSFDSPVVILVGGADEAIQKEMEEYRGFIQQAFDGFRGTIISGGTTAGIPGLIGKVAAQIDFQGRKNFKLIGYVPKLTPAHVSRDDTNYDEIHETSGKDFSPAEPLQNWLDLIAAGVKPSDVNVLGINGGQIAAFEYRLALSLGATVGIIESSGRAASNLPLDADWWDAKNLHWLPRDPLTIKSFVIPGKSSLQGNQIEEAAKAIHENYLKENRRKSADPTMLPWDLLEDQWKNSDRQQAIYAEEILKRFNYGIRGVQKDSDTIHEFSEAKEVEAMAEMEHGRWNVERLCDGWKYGPDRIPEKKISPCLVPWDMLSDEVKDWDRNAVKKWPEVFAKAGLEIYRMPKKQKTK